MLQLFIAAIFYVFATLFLFWQPLINKFGSIQWDAVTVHFFNLFFSSETWHAGIFPSWTPYIFAGFPQIADLQVAFFYPINFLISIFAIFTPKLMMYEITLHYFLAGFFTFLLAKHLSKNFWFSVAAGIVYAFGGFMTGHASHVGMQNTATWLPLIFLFLIITLKKEKVLYAAFSGLFLGIAILAGHFQIALYVAYSVTFYFIFDIIWNIAQSYRAINKILFFSFFKKIKLISTIFIIAFLVSAIQLLPTYELTQQSNRAKITLEISQSESLNPDSLKSIIKPNYNNVAYGGLYSGPWDRTQNYLYLGTTIIILAVLGIISGIYCRNTRKMTFFWLILLALSLFYSFGEFSFLQKYFYRFLPFFDKIRAPANMMILFNLSIIGLAASFFKNIDRIFLKLKNHSLTNKLQTKFNSFKKIFSLNAPALLGIGALIIISLDVLPAARRNTLLYSRQTADNIVASSPVAEKIIQEYSLLNKINKFRTFKVPSLDQNLSQIKHIFAFDGYNPLFFKRHGAYVDEMIKNANLIDLAAIKYLPCEFIASRANELEKFGSLCINLNYLPLAFFTDNHVFAENETAALQKIQTVDLKKTIVLEEIPAENADGDNYLKNNLSKKINEISIAEFQPGFWRLEANIDQSDFLFLNQANYPGWNAKIDGKPAKIYQADYLFQAIFVPSGKHTIILKHESEPLIKGAILTIIGLLLAAIIIFCELKKNRKK